MCVFVCVCAVNTVCANQALVLPREEIRLISGRRALSLHRAHQRRNFASFILGWNSSSILLVSVCVCVCVSVPSEWNEHTDDGERNEILSVITGYFWLPRAYHTNTTGPLCAGDACFSLPPPPPSPRSSSHPIY